MVLLDLAESAVKKCEGLGADEAEAFLQRQRLIEVVLERGEIQSERVKTRRGIGIRLIKEKKLGFTHSSVLTESEIEGICKNALKLTKVSVPNVDWVSLPIPKEPLKTPVGVYDEEVANLDGESALNLVVQAYDAVKEYDLRALIDDGKLSAFTTEVAIANSHGITLEEKSTLIIFFLVCIAKEKGETSSFAYEYDVSRSLDSFSPKRVGETASKRAIDSLNPKAIESFEGGVILEPDPAAEILFSPVVSSVNADNVQRRRSIWTDKIGEVVSDFKLTVVDNGLLPYGIGSSSFDAEGVPSQKNLLIEKGVLKGFLYDTFTAHKDEVESTGNAARSGYSSPPSISISNLLIEPGDKTLEDLVSDVEEGIIVGRFSGNVNPQSGDFSGIAKQAGYIKDGELRFSLRETMISGNVFQALKNIVEIGSERRPTFMGVYTPPILLENVKIVSR